MRNRARILTIFAVYLFIVFLIFLLWSSGFGFLNNPFLLTHDILTATGASMALAFILPIWKHHKQLPLLKALLLGGLCVLSGVYFMNLPFDLLKGTADWFIVAVNSVKLSVFWSLIIIASPLAFYDLMRFGKYTILALALGLGTFTIWIYMGIPMIYTGNDIFYPMSQALTAYILNSLYVFGMILVPASLFFE